MYIFPFTLFTQQYTPILLLFSARINSRELTGSLYNFTPYLNTGKKHTKEAISLLKAAYANREKSPVQPPVGIEVEITDLETKITTTYESIRKAAKAIGSDIKSISRREKSQLEKGINTPYRNRYMIVIRRS